MTGDEDARDLATLVVPAGGSLLPVGSRWEPYRLVDPGGGEVAAATAYFRDLQAGGCSEATVRSYGMDLLRWFRFLWASRWRGTGPAGLRLVTSAGGC
jgi:hypothetical protein